MIWLLASDWSRLMGVAAGGVKSDFLSICSALLGHLLDFGN